MSQSLDLLLIQFLMPDNDARRQAEDQIKCLAKDPQVVPALIHHLRTAKTPYVPSLSVCEIETAMQKENKVKYLQPQPSLPTVREELSLITMAKRELSSTLKNLKFMQRATQKEEILKKEEEVMSDGNFPSSGITKKCVVIMEGDPNPGAIRGRMSFRSFNPSIDKLNGEAANPSQPKSSTCSENQGGRMPDRDNGLAQKESDSIKGGSPGNDANGNLKRKQADIVIETQFPNKSPKNVQGNLGSSSKMVEVLINQSVKSWTGMF